MNYLEEKAKMKYDQQKMSYEQIKSELQGDIIAELDKLQPQTHNWTDRGAKLTCENAGHSYHEVWKRR